MSKRVESKVRFEPEFYSRLQHTMIDRGRKSMQAVIEEALEAWLSSDGVGSTLIRPVDKPSPNIAEVRGEQYTPLIRLVREIQALRESLAVTESRITQILSGGVLNYDVNHHGAARAPDLPDAAINLKTDLIERVERAIAETEDLEGGIGQEDGGVGKNSGDRKRQAS